MTQNTLTQLLNRTMPLLGKAAIAMWWTIAPELKGEFEDWHSHEHFPERMAIPGFNRGSRWADAAGGTGYFVLYELDHYETLTSPAYRARLDSPTPWSTRMMPHHQAMVRSQCRMLGSFGGGVPRVLTTLRCAAAAGREAGLTAWLVGSALPPLVALPGITGAHLLQTQTPQGLPMTTEQKIRGGDAAADLIVVLGGYSSAALAAVTQRELNADALQARGASGPVLENAFALSYARSAGD
ncbi:hypothetical protein BH11PSE7_BH11PSE7_35880 [soil metagenome]